MTVIIIGAGTIGCSLAEYLFDAGMDVVVIDVDKQRLMRLEEALDVQTLEGHGCDPNVLLTAGAMRADLLLAMTSNDEVNLLAAATGKNVGVGKTVARVKQPQYLQTNEQDFRRLLGIDMIISPEILTASEIVKFLDNPDALALEFYAQGKVQLLQFELPEQHVFCGKHIYEIKLPGAALVVLITRGHKVLIPRGGDILKPEDRITLLGKTGTLENLRELTRQRQAEQLDRIVIAGGGRTGLYLAQTLDKRMDSIKILEVNEARCRELSTRLERATILLGDAMERSFLQEERIGNSNVFVAAMSNDEANIMACLMAKQLGVEKCIAIVKRPDYSLILEENTEIDLALSPREICASRIMSVVKRGAIRNLSLLEEGQVEIAEYTVPSGAKIIDIPLKELQLPEGSLAAMIQRGKTVRIPRGDDAIHAGDKVIMVCLSEVASKIDSLF